MLISALTSKVSAVDKLFNSTFELISETPEESKISSSTSISVESLASSLITSVSGSVDSGATSSEGVSLAAGSSSLA